MLDSGNFLRQCSAQEFLSLDIKFLPFEYCEIFKKSFFYRTPLLAASGYYFTTAKLITKLVSDFLWLKVFSNPANILLWNQPRIQGIFHFWYRMAVKVFRLYLELFRYQRGEMPWRLSSSIWSLYKTDTSQSMMFPFILRISFVNLNQFADSCRFAPIKKRNF